MIFPVPIRQFVLVSLALLSAPSNPIVGASVSSRLLVVNQGDASLSIVDPVLGRQIAALTEGVPHMVGHEVTTTPDGQLAFLPLYGDSGVGKPGTNGQTILIINLGKRAIEGRIDLGHGV